MFNYIQYECSLSKIACYHHHTIEYIDAKSTLSYLNELCLFHGSSLKGRQASFRALTGKRKFIPIIVSDTCIYFPLDSSKNPSTIWVRYEAIASVTYKEKTCILFFNDSTRLLCNSENRIKEIFQSIQKYKLITSRTI